MGKTLRNRVTTVIIGTLASLSVSFPLMAAEKIRFVYDSILISIPVSSLDTFAREGKASQQLNKIFWLAGANEEDQAAFRNALNKSINIDPLLLSRSLNTEEGERLLSYFGNVINVQGGRNGKYIIRGAIMSAALSPEGLTPINVLNNFSTNVEINLRQALVLSKKIDQIVAATYALVNKVQVLAADEAKNAPKVDFSQLPDIRQPGPMGFIQQRWDLYDPKRRRRFYVEVYQPKQLKGDKVPVVVLSHGLASRPEDFANRAEHLASYGYVVVMPQHPGSDLQQAENFINGYTFQIFQRDEFIDRPLDISYTLDELERRNQNQFQGKLDLKNVGAFGHSFGGYAVLAVAGATLDLKNLENKCNIDIGQLNLALLLQCRALKLDDKVYDFTDKRITSVFAINPVNAAIFGQRGLQNIRIPIFLAAGSYDPATPFVFEQSLTFPRLVNTKDKYLQLQEGQAHVDFSQLDAGMTDLLETTLELNLPSPELLDNYTNSMMLAFFQTYNANDPKYKVYLQSAYVNYLSEGQEFKSHLITDVSAQPLEDFIFQFIRKHNIDLIADSNS